MPTDDVSLTVESLMTSIKQHVNEKANYKDSDILWLEFVAMKREWKTETDGLKRLTVKHWKRLHKWAYDKFASYFKAEIQTFALTGKKSNKKEESSDICRVCEKHRDEHEKKHGRTIWCKQKKSMPSERRAAASSRPPPSLRLRSVQSRPIHRRRSS